MPLPAWVDATDRKNAGLLQRSGQGCREQALRQVFHLAAPPKSVELGKAGRERQLGSTLQREEGHALPVDT